MSHLPTYSFPSRIVNSSKTHLKRRKPHIFGTSSEPFPLLLFYMPYSWHFSMASHSAQFIPFLFLLIAESNYSRSFITHPGLQRWQYFMQRPVTMIGVLADAAVRRPL